MAQQLTLARPYARAVFSSALAHEQIDAWSQVLQVMALTVQNPDIIYLITDPSVADNRLQSLIFDVVDDVVKTQRQAIGEQLTRFVVQLLQHKRLLLLPGIADLYQKMLAEKQGVIELDVICAKPLNDQQQRAFYQALEKRFHSKVEITFEIDPQLIGGALVRTGNWVMDGSVRGKLTRLGYRLTS